MKILLADDSVTMHRAVSLALKKESYELICVDNGKDALRLVHEHRPQIVLLDLDMPEMTGIEVAQEIRSDATLKSVQIVLLCGSFDEVNEKDIEKAPVDARLWKPFESHVLLAMLRTLRGARTPSAQASATAPGIASEATAPQAPRPAALPRNLPPTPRAPLPKLKTRKEEVVESASLDLEDRSQTIPNDSTEQLSIRQSVEATMPLTRSVSDLFDPLKRPAIPDLVNMAEETDGGDFTRELARETFSDRPFPDELPSPSEAAERTAPLRGAAAAPQNAQPKEDPFVNNLWSSEELSSYEEETSFAANSEMTKEPSLQEPNFPSPTELSMPQGGDLDFEVLDPHRISAESTTSAHHSDSATAPWQNANVEDFDRLQNDAMNEIHSTLRERTGISNVASASGAAPANEDLRRVVAEEVKRAFHGWLRDELQRQLSEVMSELDGELS